MVLKAIAARPFPATAWMPPVANRRLRRRGGHFQPASVIPWAEHTFSRPPRSPFSPHVDQPSPAPPPPSEPPPRERAGFWRWVSPLLELVLFVAGLAVIRPDLRRIHYSTVRHTLHDLPRGA